MRTLRFNVTNGALTLCSYLAAKRPGEYTFGTLPASRSELEQALRDPDTVLCLSICSTGDCRLADSFFRTVRASGIEPAGFPKFILGGSAFAVVDAADFAREFPEISYIVVGDGEEALVDALEGRPDGPVLQAAAYPVPEVVELQPTLPWHAERPIPLARGKSYCSWNLCRFCHHTPPAGSGPLSVGEICDRMKRYHRDHGWRYFYLYDNYLEPEDLEYLLRYCEREQVPAVLDVFGMRLVRPVLELRDVLPAIPLVRSIGWGLELYHQPELKRFRKGIHVRYVEPILRMAHEAGVRSTAYVLFGLPNCDPEAYDDTLRFLERSSGPGLPVGEIMMSWFLYSPGLAAKIGGKQFGVEPGTRYMLNEYFGNQSEFPSVGTSFHRFDTRTPEGERFDRDQVFLRHGEVLRRLLSLPAASYDYRAFFLRPETWKNLWGPALPSWLRAHAAPVPSARVSGGAVQRLRAAMRARSIA